MKTEDDRNKLASTIEEYAPVSWESWLLCHPGPWKVTEYEFFPFSKYEFFFKKYHFLQLCWTLCLEGVAYVLSKIP